MILGILHTSQKKGKEAYCRQCNGPIEVKDIHALIVLRYGKAQKIVAKIRKGGGNRTGLLYHRVHLQCLAAWALETYMRKSDARKERTGGRPTNSGLQLPDEVKLVRRRLVRKRAALLRRILATDDKEEIACLYTEAGAIRSKIQDTGIDVCLEMARRDNGAINRKLDYARRD
ncbi:hypothetical protein LCGC14_2646080 [marine sediment metagenome]|uniref:Uncharacterized protein n=1 Tax=marine sediment metagenome TaxID=412755 RepID=A0A0F9CN96_9ZZZZ